MSSWREDYLDRLVRPEQTQQQVFAELAAIFLGLGFEHCSFGVRLPAFGDEVHESWSTTYPLAWQSRYLSQNYLEIDPVIATALHKDSPVVWDDDSFESQRAFWEDARAYGVRYGWAMAMHGRAGETGLISLARSGTALSAAELAETEAKLVWLAHTANGVMGNLVAQKRLSATVVELTEREREVLRWTAVGKTSAEIAVILGISSRTVNFHITTVMLKLDAVNRTQAVIKAVMSGLL